MFFSRRYRPNKWPFYALLAIELPLTVALLAFFGIAAPDTYRTRLWQDGSDNGFNSNPNAGLYAAANYQPFTTPKVWAQFITSYNVVIAVLSMFLMLVKGIMYIVHVFPPVLSVFIHSLLIALYSVSIAYQSAKDMSDPKHPQPGPPWYISKSCSVASNKSNIGYCKQAKAAFACTCVMFVIFVFQFGVAFWSCFPSQEQKEERAEIKRIKAERWGGDETSKSALKSPITAFNLASRIPPTPGPPVGLNPMTPRTLAFNRLGGTKDLPLRNHFMAPDLESSPMSPGFERTVDNGMVPRTFFPPPPKSALKKKR